MLLTGHSRAVGALGVLIVTLAACTGTPSGSGAGQFVRYENAVTRSPVGYAVPTLLVPFGGCVLGVDGGAYQGRTPVTTTWVGDGACTRLTVVGGGYSWRDLFRTPPGSGDGDMAVSAAIPMDDGSVIAAGESAALQPDGTTVSSSGQALLRRDTDGSVHPLTVLPYRGYGPDDQGARPSGLARIGQRLLATGSGEVNGQTVPVVWESTDGGASVSQIPLPSGSRPRASTNWSNPTMIASAGQTVLASPPYPSWIWRSVDGGQDWMLHPLQVHADVRVLSLVRSDGRWLLILTRPGLTAVNPDTPSAPLALSSTDGRDWTPVPGPDRGGAQIVAATTDHDGKLVLVGKFSRPDSQIITGPKKVSVISCGVVWTGSIDFLRRQDLGCGRDSEPVSVATLTDGRVLIAGNRDLWIRN